MKSLILLVLAAVCILLSLSCASPPDGLHVAPGEKVDIGHPTFGTPILLKQSDFLLIPFWMQLDQSQMQKFSVGFSGSYSQYSGGSGSISISPAFGDYSTLGSIRWNNIVIYDKNAAQCHLLLDHKAVISKVYAPHSLIDDPAAKPVSTTRPIDGIKYLLLGIEEQDTNGDGYINDEDAIVLYAVDLANPSPIRLTPAGTQLQEIVADGATTLYIRVLSDSDGDRQFTTADESVILHVDLLHPAEGQPVLDEQVRKRARSIIDDK